ncbi:hypothetical protein HmCmsJML122_02014 [Escherichia coli]|nr:ead/Ea22-like family protein [Escherichia coli]MDM9171872.1 ead/Ea22-like family protein [Escherichia coli]GCY27971.1 hypothetical protein HmCmsJML122_02014 [Escherichia coli]
MTINYQALREAAVKAGEDKWQAKKINGDFFVIRHGSAEIDCKPVRDFVAKANPATVLALLDEIEAKDRRITELEAREVQLPTRYDLRYGHPINADKRHVMIPKENGSWLCLIDLEHALRVAGIRIKGDAGEQNDEKP